MCGCSSRARMSRSRAKRCARSRRSRLISGSLSATSRVKAPSARSASHTSAMPPLPISRFSRYGPMRSPGARPLTRAVGGRPIERRQTRQHIGRLAAGMRCQKLAHGRRKRRLRRRLAAQAKWRAQPAPDRALRQAASITCSRWWQRLAWTPLDIRKALPLPASLNLIAASTPARTRAPFPTGGVPCARKSPSARRLRPRYSPRSSASRRSAPASDRRPRAPTARR